ncbi:MAG: hypothetical protein ACTSRG_22290 [Candidatus Helarchaeota archaeon]
MKKEKGEIKSIFIYIKDYESIQYHTIPSFTRNFFIKFFQLSIIDGVNFLTFYLALEQTSHDFSIDGLVAWNFLIAGYVAELLYNGMPVATLTLGALMEGFYLTAFAISPDWYIW